MLATANTSVSNIVMGIFSSAALLSIFWPVSYTHLDVYKRQGLHGAAIFAAGEQVHDGNADHHDPEYPREGGPAFIKKYGISRIAAEVAVCILPMDEKEKNTLLQKIMEH